MLDLPTAGRTVAWRVLGPVGVVVDGSPLPVNRPQQRAVLAYLLINANIVVSAEQLVEALWGGAPTATARTQLQVCVSQLRRALRGARVDERLITQSGGYRLVVAESELDVTLFGRYVAQARAAAVRGMPGAEEAARLLHTGLACWRGEPLTGAAAAFVDAAAESLREQRLAAYEELGRLELELGRPESVASTIRPLVASHPLRERLVALLVRALAGCGQQAAALRLYDEARRRLADDLGVQPSAELAEAYLSVLRSDHPVPSPIARPAQLPADLGTFVGRAAPLRALDELLTIAGGRTAVLVAIDGMAGVGKTSLAVHWAHRVAGSFGDGQLWINLRGFGPTGSAMRPAEAIRGLLGALDIPAGDIPPDLDAQVGLYRSALAGKRMLVVLDNARDAEQVRPLLPGAAGCAAVVTSRNRLVSLAAVEGAHLLTIHPLDADEAPELLARRLGPRRLASERGAVNRIVAACAGLPLALSIVAARASLEPQPTLDELARRLGEARGLDLLHAGDAATDVRAVLSWSYRAVSPAAARLFRLLGLHPGADLAPAAAASIAGLCPDEVRPLLAELTGAHLLTQPRHDRYALHDLLRAYASELADSAPDRRAALHRVLDHYLHAAIGAGRQLDPNGDGIAAASPAPGVTLVDVGGHDAALAWFTLERPVLLAAITLAASNGFDEHTWQLAAAAREFLVRHGHWHELAAAHEAALAATWRLADRPAQARTHGDLARGYAFLGRHDDAQAHLQHALELFRALGDPAGQAHTHLKLGGLLAQRGRPDDALREARTALEQFEAIGHDDGYARALNNLGWYHAQLGDTRATLTYCQQALALHRRLGNRRGQADTRDSLGFAHHHLGNHRQATTQYRHAIALYHELGDRSSQAQTLARLGDLRLAVDDRPGAREAWLEALGILDQLPHRGASDIRVKLQRSVDAVA